MVNSYVVNLLLFLDIFSTVDIVNNAISFVSEWVLYSGDSGCRSRNSESHRLQRGKSRGTVAAGEYCEIR
jgi:hypothetical protein